MKRSEQERGHPYQALAMAALLAITPANAAGHDTDGIWWIQAASYCMIQDQHFASLPTARALAQDEGIARWIAALPPELKQCIVTKRPMPPKFCVEYLSADPNPGPDNAALEKLRMKYLAQLSRMEKLDCGSAK